MKGLELIPGPDQLARAYARLQAPAPSASGGEALDCGELALLAQWARFDPRLAEQLVAHLARHWSALSPQALHDALARQPWPAAMGVLLEQAALSQGVSAADRKRVREFAELVLEGLVRGEGASFFIGTRAFGGKLARLDAELATRPYLRWGFLGRELLFNKAQAKSAAAGREVTLVSRARRGQVLTQLIEERRQAGRSLTVQDYRERLESLGGAVGRRQAEVDLASDPRLRPRGRTRARVYLPAPGRGGRRARD